MWFSRRSFLSLAVSAVVAACGFTPVYGPGGTGAGLRGAILVDAPDTRNAFDLVGRLEQRLGQPQAASYALGYTITTRVEGVGITPAQETTRYNLFGTIDYTLTDRATDEVVSSGTVENFTGYSATILIVGTKSVTRDANARLMVALADQIVARLIATAPDWRR